MTLRPHIVWILSLCPLGCASSTTARSPEAIEQDAARRLEAATVAGDDALRAPSDDELSRAVTLASLEAAVLARHPSLRAPAQQARAHAARARAEGRLPAPELMVEIWQIPFERPYAVHDAGMWMHSLRQKIPAAGMREGMSEAARHEADASLALGDAEARLLVREVGHAFAGYVEASARHATHRRHVALVTQLGEAARARYAANGSLGDVVEADLERARLEAELAREAEAIAVARASLNGLLLRRADAVLGLPEPAPAATVALTADAVATRAAARHPEVAASEAMARAATSEHDAAASEASTPMFDVGLNVFAPVGETPFGYGVSLGMTLPFLWGQEAPRAEAADRRALARKDELATARQRVRAAAMRAHAAVRGAERRLRALEDLARPAAGRALDAVQAGYAAGATDVLMWLDAQRAALDVELEIVTARADLDRALADLDWTAGERLPRVPLAPTPTGESP